MGSERATTDRDPAEVARNLRRPGRVGLEAKAPGRHALEPDRGTGSEAEVLDLQRTVGNRATVGLLGVGQAKLDVGPVGDRYEQEADQVARNVVAVLRSPQSTGPAEVAEDDLHGVGRWSIQRREAIGAEGGALDAETESAIRGARGGGSALGGATRTQFESAFGGADFSEVRLHSGPAAAQLNDRVQAKAFTIGSDIFFRGGVPDAGTSDGQELLAHELTHTIQQGH
jgi:hypothetical protein